MFWVQWIVIRRKGNSNNLEGIVEESMEVSYMGYLMEKTQGNDSSIRSDLSI